MVLTMSNKMKGSMIVEASLILPVVVICILPFLYLFRMLLFQMVLEKGVDECVKQMAIEMYVLERISILPECNEEEEKEIDQSKIEQLEVLVDEYTAFFEEDGWKEKLQEWGYELAGEMILKERLEEWLKTEKLDAWGVRGGWSGISVSKSDFIYTETGHHYLIKGAVSFEWENIFAFWMPEPVTIQRIYHCFVGEEGASEEQSDINSSGDVMVYRIGNGTKYHSSQCYLLSKNTYTSTQSEAEKSGRKPCERCKPCGEITVYQTKGGEHYHMGNCSYLYPDVTQLSMEEAAKLGYTGCGLCQGENQYFS